MTFEFVNTYVRTVFMFGYPVLACFVLAITGALGTVLRGIDLEVIGKGWMRYFLFAIIFCDVLLDIGLKAVEDLLRSFPDRPLLGLAGLAVVVAFCAVFTGINCLFASFHPWGLNAVRIFLFLLPWIERFYPFAVYAVAGFTWEEYTWTPAYGNRSALDFMAWPWLLYFIVSPRIRKNWPRAETASQE